jgi:hypothetical protein
MRQKFSRVPPDPENSPQNAILCPGMYGQKSLMLLHIKERFMSLSLFVRKMGVALLAVASPAIVFGQTTFVPLGNEYAIAGSLPGDQYWPQIALGSNGGCLVWQDNTDGAGWGVSAMRVDGSFSSSMSPFRVNQVIAANQENPQVSLLNGGGVAFVWQGGSNVSQHIYARFLSPTNTWLTGDVMVNTYTNHFQITPAIATLTNGNVIVVWSSFDQAGSNSLQDVYAQILAPSGQKVGGELPINEFTPYNQRSPSVAALAGGGFVVVWVSEQERVIGNTGTNQLDYSTQAPIASPSVDIYARLFDVNGNALGNEFLVNTNTRMCACPNVAATAGGGFMVTWMEKDLVVTQNGWDVYARPFSLLSNVPIGGSVQRVNTQLYGDQYLSKVSPSGTNSLIVWTSMGQDGSREGVYGQFLNGDGTPDGGEFRVNTVVVGPQMQQAVASDGLGHFVVVWTTFVGGGYGYDLHAQRYVDPTQPLGAPAQPAVTVVSSNALTVSWLPVAGLNVADYEVFADGATNPTAVVTNNIYAWTMTGLAPLSTHTFQLAYVLAGGQSSLLSLPASGMTGIATGSAAKGGSGGAIASSGTPVTLPFPDPINPPAPSNAVAASFSAIKGAYNGLFYDTNGVTSQSAGSFTATVSANRSFSAKLQLGAQSYSFSGQFNASGFWSNSVAGRGLSPLLVWLQLDLYGNDQISGQVSNGQWTAVLLADLAVFSSANGTPLAGQYTFVIPGDVVTASSSPAGDGVGAITVGKSGGVQWSGTLADGTSVAQSTALSKHNTWPLYVSLYNGGGLIIGWVQFASTPSEDLSSQVVWIQPGGPGTKYYPGGFTNEIPAVGSAYVSPPAPFGNAQVIFSGGNLASPLTIPVGWTKGSTVVNQSTNPFSLSLTTSSGLFKGSVTLPGMKQGSAFQGVLFEKSGIGQGYFLGTNQSGQLNFGPTP